MEVEHMHTSQRSKNIAKEKSDNSVSMIEYDETMMDRETKTENSLLKQLNVPHDEITLDEKSQRSTLSTTLSPGSNSLDLNMEANIDTSIDQLYRNICEMQSSDHSPSRRSFLSYGEESLIDSELRFLAGGDFPICAETKNERDNEEERDDVITNKNNVSELSRRLSLDSKISPVKDASRSKIKRSNGNNKHGGVWGVMKKFNSSVKKENKPSSVGVEAEHYLGPYLLKQARDVIASSQSQHSSQKALQLALRAKKSFERAPENENPNLDYVMCLHVVAALHSRLGNYSEAIPVLKRSIDIPSMDLGHDHVLAKFAGCMQLGDTYAMLGQVENSILFYAAGSEIQRQAIGENDPRFAETLRYLAEAHIQAMQLDEAERLCLESLRIRRENAKSGAIEEEASDRRLLGLICEAKGDYETALEHYVLASVALSASGRIPEVASADCSIGDAYLSMARYDEAVFAYQKSLNAFKSRRGEGHSSVASVYVRLADLYHRVGKFGESKTYCESALRIYAKPLPGAAPEEIASGLVDVSAVFQSNDQHDRALQLLKRAVRVYGKAPGQQSVVAGIEAQMGVLCYVMGDYAESYECLKSATLKLRGAGEKRSAVFGISLNQMGLACVRLLMINEAAELFEEAREILEAECGPYHADTLGVYSNLAGTYDAMGRTSDAIEILEYVVEMREEKLGTANPDVEDEKRRLSELLQESGTVRNRRSKPLEKLFFNNSERTHHHL